MAAITPDLRQRWTTDSARWPGGMLAREAHYLDGKLNDAPGETPAVSPWPDGTLFAGVPLSGALPAVREWHCGGALLQEDHYLDGVLNDAADGTPARRALNLGGQIIREEHYLAGKRNDLPDGTPAVREWHCGGALRAEAHYLDGIPNDLPDGTPAERRWHYDGRLTMERHYRSGRYVPPPAYR